MLFWCLLTGRRFVQSCKQSVRPVSLCCMSFVQQVASQQVGSLPCYIPSECRKEFLLLILKHANKFYLAVLSHGKMAMTSSTAEVASWSTAQRTTCIDGMTSLTPHTPCHWITWPTLNRGFSLYGPSGASSDIHNEKSMPLGVSRHGWWEALCRPDGLWPNQTEIPLGWETWSLWLVSPNPEFSQYSAQLWYGGYEGLC